MAERLARSVFRWLFQSERATPSRSAFGSPRAQNSDPTSRSGIAGQAVEVQRHPAAAPACRCREVSLAVSQCRQPASAVVLSSISNRDLQASRLRSGGRSGVRAAARGGLVSLQDVNTQVGHRWHKEIERRLHAQPAQWVVLLWSDVSRDSIRPIEEAGMASAEHPSVEVFIEQVEYPTASAHPDCRSGRLGCDDGHPGLGAAPAGC